MGKLGQQVAHIGGPSVGNDGREDASVAGHVTTVGYEAACAVIALNRLPLLQTTRPRAER